MVKTTYTYAALATAVAALLGSVVLTPESRFDARRERHDRYSKVGNAGDESAEQQTKAEQYAQARTAPGIVLPGAYSAAFASLNALPVYGKASWAEVTNRPYNSDDPRYRDPFASNS